MKIHTPPRPARTDELFDLERTDERFQGAIWDLITAYGDKLNTDDLRHALEEVLVMYYDLNGDGAAGIEPNLEESEMSVTLMTDKSQQWLRLRTRECTILDAMLEWAKITAKILPDRVQVMDDGEKYIVSGGEFPKVFHVSRFDGGVPGIGWGSMDYWAVKAGQDSDWHLLFDDDRGTVLEEVRWATNELHGINTAHSLAPDATIGHPYTLPAWWEL